MKMNITFFISPTERDVFVSPLYPLCNEVQPDVKGQPDRAHHGGGGEPERLWRRE